MNTLSRSLRSLAALSLLGASALLGGCPASQPVPDPVPQAQPEAPKPAPKVTVSPVPQEIVARSGIESFEVDGLKVVLKRAPGKPVVDVELLIKGGLATATPQNIGLESLALGVASAGGTASTPRDEFKRKLESMGSGIGGGGGRDSSSLSMSALRPYFEDTWTLFSQVLTQPAFDEQELALARTRTLESIQSREDSPDQYLPIYLNEVYFKGHPYAWEPSGTVENVQRFTRQDLADHFKGLLSRERLVLFVVGDVDRPTLEGLIKRDLASLPKGNWVAPEVPEPTPPKAGVSAKPKEAATNYMMGFFRAPSPDHPDYYPLLVATSYLSDRLFEEVRTKRNLTYAVSSGTSSRRSNVGYFYTTTVKPNETVQVIYQEIDRLQAQPISAKELNDQVQVFLTEHFMRQETVSAQAGTLVSYENVGGGWEQSLVFLDRIKAVTPEEIQRVSKTYLTQIHWAYLGKPEAADAALLGSK